jgi:DNA polymerase III delta subunit
MIKLFLYSENLFIAEQILNKITCFQGNGSKEELIDVQHTIPDINSFEVFNRIFF